MTTPVLAERLAQHNRHALIRRLHREGRTDVEIAELTLLTTYTAARIRSSLGLAPNEKGGSRWQESTPASSAPSGAPATTSATGPPRPSGSTF